MINALVCLANDFEETEGIVPVDIMRRAGIEVTVAGVGSKTITSAHGINIVCDKIIEECEQVYDIIVLPGGPGAINLSRDFDVMRRIINIAQTGLVCAICAAPAVVLGNTGLLEGKEVVCYPGTEVAAPTVKFVKNKRCIVDGNIITAAGPGVAVEFAFKIVEIAISKERSDAEAKGFLAKF
ncbi:MAG: DJ-1/PfpI family protein [Spirochaetaceae bacterium]|nr:DJ-1/PfpI family protein [Spirochaetaceae bacterium]